MLPRLLLVSLIPVVTSLAPAAFVSNAVSKARSFAGMQNNGRAAATQSPLFMSTVEDAATVQVTKPIEQYVEERGGNRPIRKVLIANNGMAATKSILSMRQWAYMELGDERAVQFVAMASPEDLKANAEFIRLADSFVEVPAGKNSNTTHFPNISTICSSFFGKSSVQYVFTASAQLKCKIA